MKSREAVINYSNQSVKGCFHISPSGFLETGPVENNFYPGIQNYRDYPVLFPVKDSDLGFDIFSAVFYMISRYEEYQESSKDRHNRYQAKNSLAVKENFIDKPIVNIWISIFQKEVGKVYPSLNFTRPGPEYLNTVDIDNPWAHKNKTFIRWTAGLIKFLLTGNFELFKERIQVTFSRKKDPYDSYDLILKYPDKLRVFLLMGCKGSYDNRFSPNNKKWRRLIKYLAEKSEVGLHPSDYSNYNEGELKKELGILKEISQKNIFSSRQHFLILEFPKTYQGLIREGIKEDFSMGYSEITGFRAGTANSFLFYDLENEKQTDLRIHPFVVMDRTLKDYLKFSPQEAINRINELISMVKIWGGCFIPVWHNESLGSSYEWKEWNSVYLDMQNELKAKLEN